MPKVGVNIKLDPQIVNERIKWPENSCGFYICAETRRILEQWRIGREQVNRLKIINAMHAISQQTQDNKEFMLKQTLVEDLIELSVFA